MSHTQLSTNRHYFWKRARWYTDASNDVLNHSICVLPMWQPCFYSMHFNINSSLRAWPVRVSGWSDWLETWVINVKNSIVPDCVVSFFWIFPDKIWICCRNLWINLCIFGSYFPKDFLKIFLVFYKITKIFLKNFEMIFKNFHNNSQNFPNISQMLGNNFRNFP